MSKEKFGMTDDELIAHIEQEMKGRGIDNPVVLLCDKFVDDKDGVFVSENGVDGPVYLKEDLIEYFGKL